MSHPPEDQRPAEDALQAPNQPNPSAGSGYGKAPPPQGAYPTAGEGGLLPAPPPGPDARGQYGPPGPGYGSPGAYGVPAEPQATDSLSRAWEAFKANPWPFVLAQLAWIGIFLVPTAAMVLIVAAAGAFASPTWNPDAGEYEGGQGLIAALGVLGWLLLVLVYVALGVVHMGAFASATLKTVDGGRAVFSDFFKPRNFAQLLLLALILALASAILAITVIGLLAVLFFGIWAIFFVVDRNQSAIESVKSSVSFSSRNVGQTIVLILLGYVLSIVGAILCGIGTLVTNPVTLLAYADFYRRVTGPATGHGAPGAPQYG